MKLFFCLGLITVWLTACGEFAYKRGASAQDLETAKTSCKNAGSETAAEKCLIDQGWVVQKLDALGLPDSELFATASVSEDNRNPYKAPADQASAETSEKESTPVSQTRELETTNKAGNIETVDTAKAQPVKPQASTNTLKKETAPAISPFEKYKINSWWKMGGGRDALESSMASCSTKLGDAHAPDRKNQIFTRAFAACMYENGWRGLREK